MPGLLSRQPLSSGGGHQVVDHPVELALPSSPGSQVECRGPRLVSCSEEILNSLSRFQRCGGPDHHHLSFLLPCSERDAAKQDTSFPVPLPRLLLKLRKSLKKV